MRRITLVALAALTFIAPIPRHLVEDHYSTSAYPFIQRTLTSFSNQTALALFDVLLAAVAVTALLLLVRRGRILNLLTLAAVGWLLFLAAWGLNYRRVPLEEKVAYDPQRVTPAKVTVVARRAVREMNRLYPAAHAGDAPSLDELSAALAPALERASRDLQIEPPLAARPKQTWLAPYFRRAGIDGMTDPFLLETLLAPTLLEVEQPAALAHEWAHLAGLADESEAGFLGWLTCQHGDARAQYSGWIALYPRLLGPLTERERTAVQALLAKGPREDFRRIATRLAETDETTHAVAHATYDRFLRANRIPEGIQSYDAVVRLVVGTDVAERFNTRRN